MTDCLDHVEPVLGHFVKLYFYSSPQDLSDCPEFQQGRAWRIQIRNGVMGGGREGWKDGRMNGWMIRYNDVIMTTMASQITSLTIVYSKIYSDADQRKHQSSASLDFVWGIHRDRWIPRTKAQLRRKCFHFLDEKLWFFIDISLRFFSLRPNGQ